MAFGSLCDAYSSMYTPLFETLTQFGGSCRKWPLNCSTTLSLRSRRLFSKNMLLFGVVVENGPYIALRRLLNALDTFFEKCFCLV